ncbi:unnamed protein product [Lampetra planeri]
MNTTMEALALLEEAPSTRGKTRPTNVEEVRPRIHASLGALHCSLSCPGPSCRPHLLPSGACAMDDPRVRGEWLLRLQGARQRRAATRGRHEANTITRWVTRGAPSKLTLNFLDDFIQSF